MDEHSKSASQNHETESDSDVDEIFEGSWSLNKRKKLKTNLFSDARMSSSRQDEEDKIAEQSKKFEELRKKSSELMLRSSIRSHKTEVRRSQKLLKRALKDPWIKAAVEKEKMRDGEESPTEEGETNWEDVKSYLSVNQHLHGPVSHGDCGPKTELEYQVEDCIKEGDFEKAELLSDTLANREFAVKIARAFSAKKYQEKEAEKKREEEEKQRKKLRWMFDPKERWQMKGNM